MSDKQRSAIRMYVRNEFSKSKTTEMLLNAYGEKRHEQKKKKKKRKTAVSMWYKRFEEGSDLSSILYKSTAGHYRPVSYPDGPITPRCRFMYITARYRFI